MSKDAEKGKYKPPEGSPTWEYIGGFLCAFGMACVGYVQGWNSPSLAEFARPDSRISMTPNEASNLAASTGIGHIMAPIINLFIVDRIGRKNSMLVSIVPLIISWGLIVVAEHVTVLIIARIISGCSIGLIMCITPMYLGEVLSTKLRGILSVIGCITFSIGILLMFVVAPYLGVRIMAGVCMTGAICFFIGFCFLPESPYFLMMVGRVEEAEISLEKLRGKTDVGDELELVKATLREKGKSLRTKHDESEKNLTTIKSNSFKQLFTIRGNIKSFFIGLLCTTLQHFCGLGTILSYCHVLYKDMNSEINVQKASNLYAVIQLAFATIGVFTVNKFNRKNLLLTSGLLGGFFLTIIGTYFFLIEYMKIDVTEYYIIPYCSILIYIAVLYMGVIIVPAVIMSEIFSTDVKALAYCIITIFGSLLGALSTKTYLLIAKSWGFGHSIPFFGYAVSTWSCTFALIQLLPETRGKNLLEIQKELNT